MRHPTKLLAVAAVLLAMPTWSSTTERPLHVVELFTSQGCSSCPPADALLGTLVARPDVLALAFHIDYWDSLGWRDRFSMRDSTERQARYVEALRLSSAFTPQVIVDGQLSFVGSDRTRIGAALEANAADRDPAPLGLSVRSDELCVFLPDSNDHSRREVLLVAYLSKASTAIGRGENSGQTLIEYNIVRQVRRLGIWEGANGEIKVPLASLPADATHAAILIENQGQTLAGAAAIALR